MGDAVLLLRACRNEMRAKCYATGSLFAVPEAALHHAPARDGEPWLSVNRKLVAANRSSARQATARMASTRQHPAAQALANVTAAAEIDITAACPPPSLQRTPHSSSHPPPVSASFSSSHPGLRRGTPSPLSERRQGWRHRLPLLCASMLGIVSVWTISHRYRAEAGVHTARRDTHVTNAAAAAAATASASAPASVSAAATAAAAATQPHHANEADTTRRFASTRNAFTARHPTIDPNNAGIVVLNFTLPSVSDIPALHAASVIGDSPSRSCQQWVDFKLASPRRTLSSPWWGEITAVPHYLVFKERRAAVSRQQQKQKQQQQGGKTGAFLAESRWEILKCGHPPNVSTSHDSHPRTFVSLPRTCKRCFAPRFANSMPAPTSDHQ